MSDSDGGAPSDDALDALRKCAAHGLPTVDRLHLDGGRPDITPTVVMMATHHKVLGLLWSAIEHDAVHAADDVLDQARQATTDALRTCLLSEQNAAQALVALGRAGVETRVLKGVAIAHLDHADPSERVYGDCDVLIRRTDYDRALTALADAGFRRAKPPVRGWWERRFAKAVVLYAPRGGELDLHMTITGGYFGERIDHARLWASRSEPFQLAGIKAHGLSTEGRLLHACCHAVLGGGSGLRVRRDIAQLVLIRGADWRVTAEQATIDGVELVLADAVRTTWGDLGLDPEHGFARWASRLPVDPAQRRAIEGYHQPSATAWGSEGRTTLAVLSRADRIKFLTGLAIPSRASLRARDRTWRQHLQLGTKILLRRT